MLEVEGIEEKLNSFLVGMEKNNYMIIAPPKEFEKYEKNWIPGINISIKYLFAGTVFSFKSKLIEIMTQKIRLFAIEYPKSVQMIEFRSEKRSSSLIPFKANIQNKIKEGFIIDITRKGCRCSFKDLDIDKNSIEIDVPLSMQCQFPGIQEDQTIKGVINNITTSGKHISFGITYKDIANEVLQNIEDYTSSMNKFLD